MNVEKGMETHADQNSAFSLSPVLSNADIADRLASLAQLLSTQKENPYKVKVLNCLPWKTLVRLFRR